MLNPPKTEYDARNYPYGIGGDTIAYNRRRCAWDVSHVARNTLQCSRKSGHGPDGLYCKQHAKMVEAALAAKE